MSLPLSRKILLIGVSVICTVMVLAAIAVFVRFLPFYGQQPADLLPANTVALLEEIDAEELQRWSEWFPVLSTLEVPAGLHTVTVLALPDGQWKAARFVAKADAPENAPHVGPFAIQISPSPAYRQAGAIATLFSAEGQKLSATAAYRDAATHRRKGEAFRFVPLPGNPSATLSDALIQAWLLGGHTHAGITNQSGSMLLALVGGKAEPMRLSLAGIPRMQSTVVCASDGAEAWARVQAQLPADAQLLIAGIADGIFEQHIGTRASLRFDLLPLTETEGCLTVLPQTSTGGMRLALRATATDAQSASGAAARLESAYLGSRTAVREEYRVFDETDFASRMIRIDDTDVATDTEDLGRGWTLKRWTEPGTGRMLVIAVRDATVVVGTDEQAVRSLLLDPMAAPRNAQLLPGTLWATGVVAAPLFERLRSGTYAPLLPPTPFLWSVERNGAVDLIVVQRLPADLTSKALDSTP